MPVQDSAKDRQRRAVIFESYGRADATDAASRIKLSLEENGYQVWIDREHLAEDEPDFWHPIEQALKSSEVVIALISPHSRRLEGDVEISPRMSVCHNELIAAVQMDKTVVCVTVVECKPPLAIAHYDPIPFTNWSASPDAYREGIQEILYWIEEGLASPRPHRRYSNYVDNLSQDKLSFPEELTATDDFVGREWLIKDKLETWLKSNSRCFVIEAEPGAGKTALVAELVRRNQDDRILAYHFCNEQNKDTVKPERFVRSIAAILSGTLPAYRERLKTSNLITTLKRENDPMTMLWQGVLEPLRDISVDGPGYIIVDALDEAVGGKADTSIPALLANPQTFSRFPSWLKLVVTTRRDDRVGPQFAAAERCVLTASTAEQEKDLRQYIERRLPEVMRGQLAGRGADSRVIDSLAERSSGNFQYANLVLNELASGQLQPDQVGALPASLAALYENRALARFPEGADFEPSRMVLGVLLAARQALTRDQLSTITQLDRTTALLQVLNQLSTFVTWDDFGNERFYRMAHKSIADWLLDPPGGSDRFRVNPERARELILAHCRDWPRHHESYAMTHLVGHLLSPEPLPGALAEALAAVRGGFYDQRRQRRISSWYDLDDTLSLVLAMVAARDQPAIVELAQTENIWQRDGVAAALQGAPPAADEFVDAVTGALLQVN
jgi:TIR domain